jgi:hypothetical protein
MKTWLLVAAWAGACAGLVSGQFRPLPEQAIVSLFLVAVGAAAALFYLGLQEET